MKLTMQLEKAISEGINSEDGLERLHKKLKGKADKYFILGEIVSEDDSSEYQEMSADLRKIDKSIKGITATTDTEYANDDGFVDDDGEASQDKNYYAFTMPEGDVDLEKELKKLDKKYSFYGVWINKTQLKTW